MTEENKKDDAKVEETTDATETAKENEVEAKADGDENKKKGHKRPPARPRKPQTTLDPDFEERVVAVNRVAKVVKGGRRFSFSALMVIGDKKGRVGYGLGKAKEVPEAIRKATQAAQRSLIKVPIDNGTLPHEALGRYCASKILFKPAADGTGVKAAGACRSIL